MQTTSNIAIIALVLSFFIFALALQSGSICAVMTSLFGFVRIVAIPVGIIVRMVLFVYLLMN